jgi:hypothetical protein
VLLENHRSKRIAFAAAKDALSSLVKELGTIAYIHPKTE